MHASAANMLSLAVLAATIAPSLAAPLPSQAEKRALGAIVGGLVRGAATGALEAGAEDIKNDLGLRRRNINRYQLSSVFDDGPSSSVIPAAGAGVIARSDDYEQRRAFGAIVGGLVRGAATGALEAGADDIKNDLGLRRRTINPDSLLNHAGPLPLGPGPVVLNDQERRALVGANRPLTPLAPGPILSPLQERRAGGFPSARESGFTRRNGESLQALDEHGFYGHGPVVLNNKRAIGPILRVGAGLLEGVLGNNNNDRREIDTTYIPPNGEALYGHGPVMLEDRAIGPILRVGAGLLEGVLGSDNKIDRREVINIPKNLLESLAAGPAVTEQQQRRDGERNGGGLIRLSALNELN